MNNGKNVMIGLFVVAAMSILVFILLYLHPSAGDNGQTLYVRFDNIDKITIGTRVTFAGKAIGEVTNIQEIPEARQEQFVAMRPEPIYIWQLTLKIDSHIKIYSSDIFSIKTSGLLGEKAIDITPGVQGKNEPLRQLTSKDIVYAESTGSVEEAIRTFTDLAKKAGHAVGQISEQLETIRKGQFWENLNKTSRNLAEITTEVNKPKELRAFMNNMVKASEGFQKASEHVVGFTGKIHGGEGTIGRLINNEEAYLQFNSVLSKANVLMDDINHYGILFHNDKNWQRLRARRMNLLAKLCTPQEFRNFFEDEIAQISTSLSRVAMILDESSDPCCLCNIVSSREFIDVYAELMRRVKSLEENINMYDQQVIELQQECNPVPWPATCE